MAPERHDFKLSGPLHLTGRSAIDWKNKDYRRSVAASLVQGVYVVEGDRQKKRKGSKALASLWWKSFNFQMLEQLKDDVDSSICGAIYKFEPPASHSKLSTDGCPCYVIAFRGTIGKPKSIIRDVVLDVHIILNELHFRSRFEIAMQAVRDRVASVGSSKVWLAGHSLGSAIALLAGKTMAKEDIFLETFLFNLPYPSVPIEKLIEHKKVKLVIRVVGSLFIAGVALVKKKKSGDPLNWAPCLFVNPADLICSEYVIYFEHKKMMEEFGVGCIERLATKVSLRGLFMSALRDLCMSAMGKESKPMGKESEPMHRIPSAYLTVNLTRSPDFKQAHGIHQWWRPDLHLESKLYKYE